MSSRLLVVFLAAVLLSGCALPELRELGCGDSVLSAGEDCDVRYVMEDGTCGEVGTRNECRYVCTETSDCPEGWRCATDGRCNQPQPVFEDFTPGASLPGGISGVIDVDGDRVGDVTGSDGATVSVSFGDDADAFTSGLALALPLLSGDAWFAPFDGDALADLIIPLERALLIFSGRSTRTFVSQLFSSGLAALDVHDAAGVVVEADGDAASEVLVLIQTEAGSSMAFRDVACSETPLPGGHQVPDLAGTSPVNLAASKRISAADLDGDGISEIALAFRGDSTLHLYTSTGSPDATDPATCLRPTAFADITLPDGYTLADGRVLFVDFEGDGDLDVLMPVSDLPIGMLPGESFRPVTSVWVARALGDGAYEPTPSEIVELTPVLMDYLSSPMAAGDLDGNGLADYVMVQGIFLTLPPEGDEPSAKLVRIATPRSAFWDEAAVVDVNTDGALDVIASGFAIRGIDWFVNAGAVGLPGLFNRFVVDTRGSVEHLILGDFNGDLSTDVAAIEVGTDSVWNELIVVFSTGAGLPGPAQPNGRVGKLAWFVGSALLPDPSSRDIGVIDGISDLVLMSSANARDPLNPVPQDASFYDLLGTTSQMLVSPLYLFDAAEVIGDTRAAIVVATGNFAGGAATDVASRGVAVLSVPESVRSFVPGPDFDTSLTLLGSNPAGELQPEAVGTEVIDQLANFNPACEHWLVGDIDRPDGTPGADELVGVEKLLPCNLGLPGPELSILVIRLLGAAGQSVERISLPGYESVPVARLVDLDGDGALELILVAVLPASPEPAAGPTSELLILWNDPACATAPFCLESSARLPVEDLRADPAGAWPSPRDVVAMQLAGDERRELAVLYTTALPVASSQTVLLGFASSADSPRDYRRIEGGPKIDFDSRIERFVAGDVNGDGLDDLVLGEQSYIRVLLQMPAEPLGTTMARRDVSAEEPQ
jgi:FG-GAP-like repeat